MIAQEQKQVWAEGAWAAGSPVRLLWATCLCAALLTQAGDSPLIISSDMSVQKYLVTQTAFKGALSGKTVEEVDMGAKGMDRSKLKEVIERTDPPLVYCIGSKAYLTARELVEDKPIVLSSAINWQRFPVTRKTFGIANELPAGMQLMMFRYFFPKIEKIGVLYSKQFNKEWLAQATDAAEQVGVTIKGKAVRKPRSVEGALEDLLEDVDALWLIADPVVLSSVKAVKGIFAQCDTARKPILASNAAFAEQGAVMAIAPDVATIGRQAAGLATDLLAKEEAEEKFQPPAGSEVTINMKAIGRCGVVLNEDALDSVNRIIR